MERQYECRWDRGENDAGTRSTMHLAVLGCLTAVLMSAVMLFGGKGILKCFLSGETAAVVQSLKIGTRFLRVLAAFFPFLYLLYILRAGIQGLGNGLIPMLSSAVQLIMRVGCALFLTRFMGCAALFWGEAAAWLGADLLLLLFWKRTYLHAVLSTVESEKGAIEV